MKALKGSRTHDNLEAAFAGDWFETLAKAERSHANRLQKALDGLSD